jgi:hypothetical protein
LKTYSGSNSGSKIEPLLWNASQSVWVISPWIGKEYAAKLSLMSQKGIEVRLITSKVDFNIEALEILKASKNENLFILVLDTKKNEKSSFVHAKIYLADRKQAISGSANLTYSGLNSNVESLSIAETEDEVLKIERDFMCIWMDNEHKSIPDNELSNGTVYSIKNALVLNEKIANLNTPNVKKRELIFHPYYFFEYIFRGSVRSPPMDFRDKGFLILDGMNRAIIDQGELITEIVSNPKGNYVVKTDNNYKLQILDPLVQTFQEAREIILDHIITKNTRHYTVSYGNSAYRRYSYSRTYDRLYVPRRYDISFLKSDFVLVPIWYFEYPDAQKVILGSSGMVWSESLSCPLCSKLVNVNLLAACENCYHKVCPSCLTSKGLIFKKKLCRSCANNT